MSEHVTTVQGKRRRWLLPATAVIVLLAGWMTYMLVWQQSNTLVLPDGSTVSFLEAGAPRLSLKTDVPSMPFHYEFEFKPKKTPWDSVWKRLPPSLRQYFPTPLRERGKSANITLPFKEILWCEVSPSFESEKWRFFWVDNQGYESETWEIPFYNGRTVWVLAVPGCVPRGQKYLHLRVRSRAGESDPGPGRMLVDGALGKVVAERKFPNVIREQQTALPLTAQSLPAKAACRDHTMTLTRVVRSRVASMLTGGLRFEMFLDDHESVNSRYFLHDWVLEDTKGNVQYESWCTPSAEAHILGTALWSDSPVWRARFWAFRNRSSDYAPDEKITFQHVPLPSAELENATAGPWQDELTLHGHKIRLHDIKNAGSSELTFRVTLGPQNRTRQLVLLSVTDTEGNEHVTLPDGRGGHSHRQPMKLVGFGDGFEKHIFEARVRRPQAGVDMTVTFGMDEGVPVEFTFRPEFEP